MLYSKKQQEEIRLGQDFGLLQEEIKLYAKWYFNAKQMCEIRLGLEEGLGIRTVKTYAHIYLSPSQMALRRQKIREGELLSEMSEHHYAWWKRIVLVAIVFGFLFFSIVLFGYAFFAKSQAFALTEEVIYLKCGERVNLLDYVTGITKDTKVIVEDFFQPKLPGTYLLVYRTQSETQEITRTLRAVVTDNRPPEITLTEEEMTLSIGDSFDCHDYIESVKDNVSSQPLTVTCESDLDFSLEKQDILYTVTDDQGNIGYAKLTVNLKNEVS